MPCAFPRCGCLAKEGTVEVLVGLAKGKPRAQNVRVAELDSSDREKVTIRSIDLAAHLNKLLPPSGSVSLSPKSDREDSRKKYWRCPEGP